MIKKTTFILSLLFLSSSCISVPIYKICDINSAHLPRTSFVQTLIKKDIFWNDQICSKSKEEKLKNKDDSPTPGCDTPIESYSGSGSGAIIKNIDDNAFVLTAGHVCDASYQFTPVLYKATTSVNVLTLNGEELESIILDVDIDNDMCIIYVPALDYPAIELANVGPNYGDKVFNIAAPAGIFAQNMVPILDGYYAGIYEKILGAYTIPAAGGSSGSPILNVHGELIGMIHSVHRRFDSFALSPSFEILHNYVKIFLDLKEKEDNKSKVVETLMCK